MNNRVKLDVSLSLSRLFVSLIPKFIELTSEQIQIIETDIYSKDTVSLNSRRPFVSLT
jgi:hypothetical protein